MYSDLVQLATTANQLGSSNGYPDLMPALNGPDSLNESVVSAFEKSLTLLKQIIEAPPVYAPDKAALDLLRSSFTDKLSPIATGLLLSRGCCTGDGRRRSLLGSGDPAA